MAKPKPKSDEEKRAALEKMLSTAATTNHLAAGATIAPPAPGNEPAAPLAPEPAPGNEEQKGENVSVAPAAETVAPAAEPAGEASPEAAALAAEPAAEPTPTPAVESIPEPVPAPAPGAGLETPTAPAAAPEAAPAASVSKGENVPEIEPSSEAIHEPGSTVEVGTVELATLFAPSVDKKVFTMRLTDAHYQYLLLLGTIVGNGASPPDIVHNVLAQFIEKNDAQIQKAITKQLRQRQGKK